MVANSFEKAITPGLNAEKKTNAFSSIPLEKVYLHTLKAASRESDSQSA